MTHLFSAACGRPARRVHHLLTLLTLLALLLAAPAARAQLFGPVTTYSSGTGGTPLSVAVGDLNGDGFRDVVTANSALNSVGVLLGTGTGSLGAVATYGTGASTTPQWVALGDLNGDGRLDVVTANYGNSVSVLLNTGSGAFGAATTYSTGAGSTPLGVALADLNGDSRLDVLTANYGINSVGVLLGSGAGGLGAVVTYGAGAGSAPIGLAVADVNRDGFPDVATANSGSNSAGVLLGTGTGALGTVATYSTGTGSSPNGVALADLNADSYPDLVTANTGTNNAGVLLNGGSGILGGVATYGTGTGSAPLAVAVADANADGRPDLVTANSGSSMAGVLLGTGSGAFGTVTTFGTGSGSAPYDVRLADLNGDNLPDLISNNNGSNTVGVLLNQTATATISSFTPTTSRAGGTVAVTGTGLAGATGVTVNGTAGTISGTPTATSLSFVVGAGSTTGLIRITTSGSGTATSATSLTIVPTPALSSATPTSGATGTVLTVSGTDLQNPTAVTFTGVGGTFAAAAGYSSNAAGTTLSNVVVPGGLQPGPATFTVTTAGGTSNTLSFQVTLPPTISSFAPTSGVAGTVVTVTGTRLSDVTAVTVNGATAAFTLGTATSLTFTVPAGAGATQQVVLTSPGGTSVPSTAFTAFVGVVSASPAANSRNAPVAGSALALTFSEPVTAISAASLKVFSSQVGGKKAGTVAVSRSTARYVSTLPAPRTDFKPGEVVSVTAPASIVGAGGLPVSKKAYQFMTAVGATGTGFFTAAATNPATSPNYNANDIAVGDVDNDGDLDFAVTSDYSAVTSVRLNNGNGTFTAGQTISGTFPLGIELGDIDNDGDLDLAIAEGSMSGSWVNVLRNNGSGTFSVVQALTAGNTIYDVKFGDFDADGDLDIIAASYYDSTVTIRFNDGTGNYSGGQTLTANYPRRLSVGDLDGDGDLDAVAASGNVGFAVCLNNGNGTFTSSLQSSSNNSAALLGDLDGDGDLDLAVVKNDSPNALITWLNNGSGSFSQSFTNNTALPSAPSMGGAELADFDGDGDLDIALSANLKLIIRLNNGRGVFGGGQDLSVDSVPYGLSTGDVDGDGDIDVFDGGTSGYVALRLNGPATWPVITSFTPTSGAQGTSVVISGTNLGGATSVSFNGTATTAIANNTATSLTVQVPAGATTGYLTVTTPSGTSAFSYDVFAVVPPPTLTTFTPTSGPVGTSVAITGTNFTGATAVGFNGTAATTFTVNSATSITAIVPAGASTGTISVTAPGGTITSTGTFTVIPPPTLTSIVANTGPTGITVSLNGTTLTGATTITFTGTANNTVTSGFTVTAAQITGIVVPGGAQTGPVTVTTPAGTSNGVTFTVQAGLLITAVSPVGNARAAAVTSPVRITFSQPVTAASASALQVFSGQRGGRLTQGAAAVQSGNTLTFTPGTAYRAGETISATVTAAAAGSGGEVLARPRVTQFRTAVSTGGTGSFQLGADHTVAGTNLQAVATADVDNDGDLDLLAGSYISGSGYVVNVRLNNGNGTSFTTGQTLAAPNIMTNVATGDIDGDGDPDLVAAGVGVMVRTNTNGTLGGSQNLLSSSNIYGVVLADVDGDADLDLLLAFSGSLGVSLNDGTGVFGTTQSVSSGSFALSLAVGDLDNDGDLDALMGTSYSPAYVYVLLNNSYGTFTLAQTVAVNDYASTVAVGDIDNDGDLDFVTCSSSTSTNTGVTLGLNNGSANFSTRSITQPSRSYDAQLADVDGDGDADLLTCQAQDNAALLRLNDGTGTFGTPRSIALGVYPLDLTLADVDADGDLDLLANNNNNQNAGTIAVRFNVGSTQPTIVSLSPTAGAVGTTVSITGTNLGAATAVSFNGTAAVFTVVNSTTITTTVPAGATTGAITVTTPTGTAISPTFTVTTPALTSVSPTSVAIGGTITLYGNGLQGTSTITFAGGVTTASGFTVNAGGTQITGIVVPTGAVTGLVTATAGTVTSNGVSLTIYQQPTITSFTPTSGPVGTSVTLTGTNLTGSTVVRVNGTSGTISSNNGTTLVFTVSSGSTTGALTVTTSGGTATGGTFTVLVPQLAVTQNGTSYPNNGTVYSFGSQVVSTTSAPVAFMLSNAGTADLTINSLTATGNYALSGAVPTTVPAGGSATVRATFTPTTTGTRSGYLTIYSSLGYYYVNLTGTGVAGPALSSISPTSGPVGSTMTLNGSNLTGTTTITFGGGATVTSGFTVTATQITGIVVPAGATTGSVTVSTASATSNGLTFTVTAPQLAVTQGGTSYPSGGAAYSFGSQVVNTTSAAVSFTLSNAGTADLSLTGLGTTGDFARSGAAPTTVPAGGSATVSVTFTPTASGTRPGTLTITSSLGTYTVNLTGTGTLPTPVLSSLSPTSGPVGTSVTISGSSLAGATSVSFNGTTTTAISNNTTTGLTVSVPAGATTGLVTVTTPNGVSNGLAFTVTAPQLAVSQNGTSYPSGGQAFSFGSQAVNTTSAAIAFTLRNAGTADLTLTGAGTTGDYALSGTTPTTIPAGGSATVSVMFTPTAGGTRAGTLVLTSSLGTYTVNLTGTGLPSPALTSVAPTSGVAGSTIVLGGTSLTGATAITFAGAGGNTVTSNFTVNGAGTQIMGVVVPTGALTGAVTVTTPGGVSNGMNFVVLRDLVISSGTTANPVVIPPGDYRNITIMGGGVAVFGGAVTVAGTLTVSGTLNTNCQSLTGPGSFTLLAGATLGICDAAGLTASSNTGAVQLDGTRTYSPDANYVYNGTGAQVTGAGLPGTVRSLTTTNSQAVTLTGPVAVTQTVTVAGAGNLVLGSSALTLLSSASGTALAVNSGTGSVVGTATVQRYIDGSLNGGTGYRHYSSPVTNTTVADLQTSGFAPTVNPAYNTSATPATVRPFPTVFGYDQARLATVGNNLSAFDKGFFSPASTGDALVSGRGYTVNLGAGQLVDFQGTLGNNDLTVNLGRNAGATAADAGWALVGNPYPAPLDYSLVDATDRPHLDAAIYVFQSSGPYAGNYRSYVNGQSTTGTNNPLLATGQGFFVRVSQGQTSGSLTFRNSQRVTDYATAQQVTFNRTTATPSPALRLTLTGQNLTDGWVTYADPGATAAFDGAFDAAKLPNSTGLNLGSVSGANQLAIDGQPAFTTATVLPLAVGVPAAGTYTLTAAALDNLPAGLVAYLRDAQTGTTTTLSPGTNYYFSVTATQSQALLLGRFTVQFAPATPLVATPAALAAAVTLYPNPAREQVTVALPGLPGTSRVQAELLNAVGQVVRRQSAALPASGTALVLPTLGLASGVYVVRLQAGDLIVAKRLTIE